MKAKEELTAVKAEKRKLRMERDRLRHERDERARDLKIAQDKLNEFLERLSLAREEDGLRTYYYGERLTAAIQRDNPDIHFNIPEVEIPPYELAKSWDDLPHEEQMRALYQDAHSFLNDGAHTTTSAGHHD
ncbi:hypothetical protein M5689_020989 [Euphorbia peplus]|nr:hypothetical protein M5689_020989 [Euphorbia peplus]